MKRIFWLSQVKTESSCGSIGYFKNINWIQNEHTSLLAFLCYLNQLQYGVLLFILYYNINIYIDDCY